MLLIGKDLVEPVEAGGGPPTWVVRDGKRVAKFQYVGTGGHDGYFTIIPVEKSGLRPRTEYLTDGHAAIVPAVGSSTCARGLSSAPHPLRRPPWPVAVR